MFRDDNYRKKKACSISMWVAEEKSNPSQTAASLLKSRWRELPCAKSRL